MKINEAYNFESLKPGDRVVVVSGYGRVRTLSTIERMTKTQIVVKNCPYKFRRESGTAIHGGVRFDSWSLRIPSKEEIVEIIYAKRLHAFKAAVEKLKPGDLSRETLDQLMGLLDVGSPNRPS